MRTRARIVLLLVVVFCYLSSTLMTPVSAAPTSLAVANEASDGAITVDTAWVWQGDREPETICLAGISSATAPDAPQMALEIVKGSSGWFTTWQVYLTMQKPHEGTISEELGTIRVNPEETIRTSLSYHPQGILSAAIQGPNDSLLLAKSWRIEPLTENLVPVASASIPNGPTLSSLSAEAWYQPVADQWEVGTLSATGSLMPMSVFDTNAETFFYISSEAPSPGEYHLSLVSTEEGIDQPGDLSKERRVELATVANIEEENLMKIDLRDIPLGPAALQLDYVEHGQVMSSSTFPCTIGRATLAFSFLGVNENRQAVGASLVAKAADPLNSTNIQVDADYTLFSWDTATLSFRESDRQAQTVFVQPVQTLKGAGSFLFSIPLPEEQGVWRVSLQVKATPAVSTAATNTVEFFATGSEPDYPIAVTDQASSRIIVFNPQKPDWNNPKAILWSWKPSENVGYSWNETIRWRRPTDVKLRRNDVWGGEWVVSATADMATIASYPSGMKKWAVYLEGDSNAHAVELLPNGNTAIAASVGGWVRVYTSSQGPNSNAYAEYLLPGAHGVVWDPTSGLLWAVGDHDLVGLRVSGPDSRPVLEEAVTKSLPSAGGHDLYPVYGDPNRLWVTTNTGAYQYIKPTNSWLTSYVDNSALDQSGIKAIGNQPSGRVVYAQKKPGTLYEFTTDTVSFLLPKETRTINGLSFYKARIWSPDYQ